MNRKEPMFKFIPSPLGIRGGSKYIWNDNGEHGHILIVSSVGGGKSIATEQLMEVARSRGYKIITLFDAKGDLENAYVQFLPQDKEHLKLLKRQREQQQSFKCKVYHPFTYATEGGRHILSKEIPETEFFTISFKSLTEQHIEFLLESNEETITSRLMYNRLLSMNREDGMYEYLSRIERETKKEQKKIGRYTLRGIDRDNFYIQKIPAGNILNLKDITQILRRFQTHFFLMPDTFHLNLNMKEIVNDKEHDAIFTCRYIEDEKVRDFVTLHLLIELLKVLPKAKHPVCLVLPEIYELVPKKAGSHKVILGKTFAHFLRIARTFGCTTISNTQSYSKTDDSITNLFSYIFLGRTQSGDDLGYLSKNFRAGRLAEILRTLDRGEFIPLKEANMYHGAVIKFGYPTHCHKEARYDYDTIFKRIYAERFKNYSHLIKEMQEYQKTITQKIEERYRKKEQEVKEKAETELKEREEKIRLQLELERIKVQGKQIRKQSKEERNEIILESHHKGLSSRDISKELSEKYGTKLSYVAVYGIIKKVKDAEKRELQVPPLIQ